MSRRTSLSTSRTRRSASTWPTARTSSERSACPPMRSSGKARPSSPTSSSCASGRLAEPSQHADPDWLHTAPLDDRGADRPDQPLLPEPPGAGAGHLEPERHALREGYSLTATATWPSSCRQAMERLPAVSAVQVRRRRCPVNTPRPHSRPRCRNAISARAASSSPTIAASGNRDDGQGMPVVYGGTALTAAGTMTGKRLAALIGLRDKPAACCNRRTKAGPRPTAWTPAANSTGPTTASLPPTAPSTRPPSLRPKTAPPSAGCPTWSSSGKIQTPCW